MFMQGDTAIFCADAVMSRMLSALYEAHPSRVAVADGDDAIMQADAFLYCRECALPLLLFSRAPAGITLPMDIRGVILQEGGGGEDGEMDQVDQDDGDCHQQSHGGQFASFCVHNKKHSHLIM